MRPNEIRDAVRRNVPVLMAAGAIEYHGPHLPVGSDYLIAEAVVSRVEQACECIVMPPLPFAPTMFWAAGVDDGEFDFDPDALGVYAREIFRGITKVGFRRVYILQHHQGTEGLPCLTLKRAAAEVTREIAKGWGSRWGRAPHATVPNPDIFSLFCVAQIDTFAAYPSPDAERCPVGHGSKGETQLMMASHPDAVKMDELDAMLTREGRLPQWLEDSHLATLEEGKRWIDFCVDGWVRELTGKGG
jgi:creatinine amidohydrolase